MRYFGRYFGNYFGRYFGSEAAPAAEGDASASRRSWQPIVLPLWWGGDERIRATAGGATIYVGVELIPGEAIVTAFTARTKLAATLQLIAGGASGDAVTPSVQPKPARKSDDADTIAAGLMALMARPRSKKKAKRIASGNWAGAMLAETIIRQRD